MVDRQKLEAVRQFWDSEAATFDNEPDHGLRDATVRQAWTKLLVEWLPPSPATVLDIGCGTGLLSLVMASLGYTVTGIDLSPAMIAHAQRKAQAAGLPILFQVMDAGHPQLGDQRFAAVLCRHLLWALPEPAEVLRRWAGLLARSGRLVLIEGFWQTGAGLHVQQVLDALPAAMMNIEVHPLSHQLVLWGQMISDERYAVTTELATTS
ncbi:MAG: methyltransferase domain-containing protein [Caldilineaceae bacterium]|nr:methyltransferase domain-containing protein [Caldilineaceae bacterium]